MNERILKLAHEVKKVWYLPIMILLGVILLTRQFSGADAVPVATGATSEQYVSEVEHQLEDMLENISGAGRCDVTISLLGGGRKEYVREEGKVLVITDKDGNQSPVLSQENMPEIAGVTVACSGADSIAVRTDIIESVSTVLGIGTNKICVIGINGETNENQ